ncbi:Pulmonary surfactant-associated protein B [Varanus komodoensis]|nr:Pulmonary surfactant-associated protein B [Varanus komodoensis]
MVSRPAAPFPAQAGRISVQNECAKGATYWCRNLMTAVQCGALEHCVEAGWSPASNIGVSAPLRPAALTSAAQPAAWLRAGVGGERPGGWPQDDTCADCKQVAAILIRMVKESSFKESIQKYLEQECAALPVQTLVPQCQTLVDTYYVLFIASLEVQLTPDVICTNLGICESGSAGSQDIFAQLAPELRRLLRQLQGQAPPLPRVLAQFGTRDDFPIPLPTCWLCTTFMGKIESAIPKGAIGKAISQLCRILPAAIAGMCQCLMERYTEIIVDMLVAKLGPSLICGMLFMCATEENCGPVQPGPGGQHPELPQVVLPVPADACRACLGLTRHAQVALGRNRTEAAAEAALLSACSSAFLDGQQASALRGEGGAAVPFTQPCRSLIHQHRPKWLALLTKSWDPPTVCQGLTKGGWAGRWQGLIGPGGSPSTPWMSPRAQQEVGACRPEKPRPEDAACAQGPVYWCSSLIAAEKCKAVQHCRAHVWL